MNISEKIFSYLEYLNSSQKQSFDVSRKFKGNDDKFYFTTWIPFEQWRQLKPDTVPNYREILQNEIVFESDLPTKLENLVVATEVMRVLEEKNFNYWCVFTGNKSYHVHMFCNDLLTVDKTLRPQVKEFFANDWFSPEIAKLLDFKNFGSRRLIQIEFATNPKTGLEPEIVKEKLNGFQPMVPIKFLTGSSKKKKVFDDVDWKRNLIPKTCDALDFCLVNKIPSGNFTRYEYVSSSLAAYIRYKSNRKELAEKYYKLQGKDGDLEAWDKKPSNFCCQQVRKYMEKNGFGKICEKCLLGEFK